MNEKDEALMRHLMNKKKKANQSPANEATSGKWYVVRTPEGDLVSSRPSFFDKLFEDPDGKGFRMGPSGPGMPVEWTEELSEKNIVNYKKENLPEELQERYAGVFEQQEKIYHENQQKHKTLIKDYLRENPTASAQELRMFQLSNNMAFNEDEIQKLVKEVQTGPHKVEESKIIGPEKLPKQEANKENAQHNAEKVVSSDKKVTVGKEQVKETASSIADPDAHHKAEMSKANKIHKTLKIGGIAAAAAIGVGSVLDLGNDLRKEKETERMKRKQEEQLRQKQRRENQTMQQNNYSYVDFGMIVGELFDDRIGHHKMGNSKFQ